MAVKKTVTVSYDAESNTLSASPSTITLTDPEDWVLWELGTPPADSTLYIQFEQPVGPFQAVRSCSPGTLVAKGNTGKTLTFSYFLFLVITNEHAQDEVARTNVNTPLTIVNECETVNTSPLVTISFVPPSPTRELGVLNLDPPVLLLHDGDIALWQVEGGLPDNYILSFQFFADGTLQPDLFSNFFMTPPNAGSQRAGGGQFNSSAVESITYRIKAWDENGQLRAESEDPTIDGLGKPPNT